MSATSGLFKLARWSATGRAVASGDPKKIGRRARNIVVGRTLARAGVWNRLWGRWL